MAPPSKRATPKPPPGQIGWFGKGVAALVLIFIAMVVVKVGTIWFL